METKLLYRKTILKNLYNFSKNLNSVMDYDDYKRVILNDEESDYEYIELLKNLYLCHFMILDNYETEVDIMFSIFEEMILKEKINFCLDIKENIDKIIEKLIVELSKNCLEEEKRYAFIYLIINYALYMKEGKMYRLSNRYMKKLFEVTLIKELYHELILLLKEEIERGYYPDKEFYKNLKEITKEEIMSTFINAREMINQNYMITHLYLYGSFAKGSYRIDSDIDVAVVFEGNMSYKQKVEKAAALKEYIKDTFKRYGDVMEFNTSILKDEKRIKIY